MQRVEVGHLQRLVFEEVRRSHIGEPESMLVSVHLKDLEGSREVVALYGKGFDDLSEFFEDLAEHWSGWQGTKSYESLEGDLLLEAAHTGSHVELSFALQDPSFPETWSVRGRVTLDPGEELTRVSNAVSELFLYEG